jgi:hypothetical protein
VGHGEYENVNVDAAGLQLATEACLKVGKRRGTPKDRLDFFLGCFS